MSQLDLSLTLQREENSMIQACIRKEAWAMRALYEEYYSPMMKVVVRYAANMDQAKDWVHDGFIKVFKYIKSYNPGSSLYSWIKRIMVNTALDHLRKEKVRRTQDIEEINTPEKRSIDAISALSAQELLQEVQALPPSYRAAFNLYVIDGYSHKEIAEMFGIQEGTSRSNLVKARRLLQKKIQDASL